MYGIFFNNDAFKGISCSIEIRWGEMDMTEVRIYSYHDLKKCDISIKSHKTMSIPNASLRKPIKLEVGAVIRARLIFYPHSPQSKYTQFRGVL